LKGHLAWLGRRYPLDQPHLGQQAGGGAERALAGLQSLTQVIERLIRRVADQQYTQHPSGHPWQAHLLKVKTDVLDKVLFFIVAFWH
jgi:hypothetical protein